MRELDEARGARHGRSRRARPGLHRDPDRRAAHARARRSSCSTTGCAPSRRAFCTPDPTGVAAAVEAMWSAHRPLVITGRGATRLPVPSWSASSTLRGAVYLDTQESRGLVPADHPARRRRHAGRRDDRGRPRARDRPQARLPARLRLAGRVPQRPLHPHRRHCRRADRQPPRRPRAARDAGAGARGHRGGGRQPRARHRARLDRGAAPPPSSSARGCRLHGRETVASDGKVHPAAIFAAIKQRGRSRLHRHRRRRRPAQLRPRRPGGPHLPGCRRLRLPRHRRAVCDRGGAGLSRVAR